MMINATHSAFFLALAILTVMRSPGSAAQTIDVPKVIFDEPSVKTFELGQQLALRFRSEFRKVDLRARVFKGLKGELIERAKNAPPQSCLHYSSVVVPVASEDGEVKFSWFFNTSALKVASEDSFDNQVYTLVLERNGSNIEDFRLSKDGVGSYFSAGQQIVVVADPGLRSNARTEVGKLQTSVPPGGSVAESQPHPVRRQARATEDCIVVRTMTSLRSFLSQLVPVACHTL